MRRRPGGGGAGAEPVRHRGLALGPGPGGLGLRIADLQDETVLAAGAALNAAVLAFAAFAGTPRCASRVRVATWRSHHAPRNRVTSIVLRALVRRRADRRPDLGWALRPDQADTPTAAPSAWG